MDKVILKQAVLDALDEQAWMINDGDFDNMLVDNRTDFVNSERLALAERIEKRYFQIMRIELAKDGN